MKKCMTNASLISYHSSHPVSFSAYFAAGSDPEFKVTPASGELLPMGSNGTMIQIVFCPAVYGKIYTGKLVIQVGVL